MNEQNAPSGVTYCPQCGAANKAGNRFCVECGNPLSLVLKDPFAKTGGTRPAVEDRKSENKKAFVWLIVLAITLVLVGLLLIVFLPGDISLPSLSGILPANTDSPLPAPQEIFTPRQELTMVDEWGWSLEDGVLTISGSGPMKDFTWQGGPWKEHADHITTVVIEDGITSVGDYAFRNCSEVTEIRLPEGLVSLGTSAFEYCDITSIELPSTLERIGHEAFSLCVYLYTVEIPASVTELPGDAFFASGVQNIIVQPGNKAYKVEDNVLYTIDGKTLVFCPDDPVRTSFSIPEGVETIGDYAFTQANRLTSVDIPESVTSVGYTSFRFMRGLKTVNYAGTEEQWRQVAVGDFNDSLTEAAMQFGG